MSRIEKLMEFLSVDPDDSFVRHALALEYLKLGDIPVARRHFEELLARDPAAVGSYYHLGKLLEGLGENASALDWYARGMTAAKAAGETRAYNELRAAYEELKED
jgi:tetratricopeptide (TPR) repeat protein